MNEASKPLTAYTFGPLRFYECDHMPSSLVNVPDTFQRLMETSINPINFSLEQDISRLFRQAFIHCCELYQVWEQSSITAIIYVARTLWASALNSEHAQSDLQLAIG